MVTRVESPAEWVESMNSGSKASSTTSTGTSGPSLHPSLLSTQSCAQQAQEAGMATTPLGDCKGGCWHTPKKFPVGHVEHGATQGDRGRSGEPSRRPGLRRGPEWKKVTGEEEALGLQQIVCLAGLRS